MKASARSYTIQGLVKYHGLRNERLRIPFHDSISACAEAVWTDATIQFDPSSLSSSLRINGREATQREFSRAKAVIGALQRKARSRGGFRLATRNSLPSGKGLGFSAAAFAAISLAADGALGLNLQPEKLSEFARLGAGSATRSLVGGLSIWYAKRDSRSFGHQLVLPERTRLAMAVVPVAANIRTEDAHRESVSSPFFAGRVRYVGGLLRRMLTAIRKDDVPTIGRLAEADTLNLHAVTMTGRSALLLMRPESLRVIDDVLSMRSEGIPAWYSLDTGPSVFVNTDKEHLRRVADRLRNSTGLQTLESQVGGPAHLTEEHLF
jgi:diphosphomevalonate decarboxylase